MHVFVLKKCVSYILLHSKLLPKLSDRNKKIYIPHTIRILTVRNFGVTDLDISGLEGFGQVVEQDCNHLMA